MISVCFQSKPFNITVIQVYAPTTNAEEAELFYEDLQDFLELIPKRDVLFIIGDWLEEAQAGIKIAGIKIAGRNINNLRYAHDTTLMAENEEELKLKSHSGTRYPLSDRDLCLPIKQHLSQLRDYVSPIRWPFLSSEAVFF